MRVVVLLFLVGCANRSLDLPRTETDLGSFDATDPCPTNAPDMGVMCSVDGLQCAYDFDYIWACSCIAGVWHCKN
jgi:hypothetical protein